MATTTLLYPASKAEASKLATMPPASFIVGLESRGLCVELSETGQNLHLLGPREARTDRIRNYLRSQKTELIAYLTEQRRAKLVREFGEDLVAEGEAVEADLQRQAMAGEDNQDVSAVDDSEADDLLKQRDWFLTQFCLHPIVTSEGDLDSDALLEFTKADTWAVFCTNERYRVRFESFFDETHEQVNSDAMASRLPVETIMLPCPAYGLIWQTDNPGQCYIGLRDHARDLVKRYGEDWVKNSPFGEGAAVARAMNYIAWWWQNHPERQG